MMLDDQIIDDPMIREDKPTLPKLVRNPWDLEVFKRAYQASKEIHTKSLTFPKFEQYSLAAQWQNGMMISTQSAQCLLNYEINLFKHGSSDHRII